MKPDKASRTAQYMALFRALETTRPASNRLFTDNYAIQFLDPGLKMAVKLSRIGIFRDYLYRNIHRRIPGALSSGTARTKLIDHLLLCTVDEDIEQVVILGAGFDTRAMRLDRIKQLPVIEIDHPNTAALKKTALQQGGKTLPANVAYWQIDFNKESLDELAARHHLDFNKVTTVIWEGVTNYLDAAAIDNTFKFISRFKTGSFVIFTYVHNDILTAPSKFIGGEKLLNDLKAIDEQWTWGLLPEQIPGFLQRFNLQVIEDTGAADYRERYMPERSEDGYEFYRVVFAEKV
jgi:methyltransferase (TIGR00027 family)